MNDYDFEEEEKKEGVVGIVQIVGSAAAVIVCLVLLFSVLHEKDENIGDLSDYRILPETVQPQEPADTQGSSADLGFETIEADPGDPQASFSGNMGDESGSSVEIAEILSASTVEELKTISYGIDVARYQGTIDWGQVAESGITFAMIRVGYRTMDTGEIVADANAKYNMQEAVKNGIKIGAYFFSTAVSTEEAVEEAEWTADFVARYQITYPVAYNCEGYEREDSRQRFLDNEQRSAIADAFLEKIYELGYTPMFYAARSELTENAKWDRDALESRYKIWVAQYPAVVAGDKPDYGGEYAMWQYTNRGTVPGIRQPVDMDIAYFGYAGTEQPKDDTSPENAQADPEALMDFSQVEETVTAKDATNLRNIPGQGVDSVVVHTLKNGETALRTGISDSGWSRVVYDGQTLYAVSSYLTTDLTAHVQEPDDGIQTPFQDCYDIVTAKMEVNLRSIPSVTNPEAQVVAVLKYGEYVTRTGINTDYGWSRVDYNGQTLYCVSSYLLVQQNEGQDGE